MLIVHLWKLIFVVLFFGLYIRLQHVKHITGKCLGEIDEYGPFDKLRKHFIQL